MVQNQWILVLLLSQVGFALCEIDTGQNLCPEHCVCEVRPWFTPQSTYREAPTVDCNDQGLTDIPDDLLPATEVLLLQGNSIASVRREAVKLVNLTDLDLSQNNFTVVADLGRANLSHLVTLHLEENRISELPEGCLKDLKGLQELYLNHNQISVIAPNAFVGLTGLLRLHLNSNLLRAVDRRWFEVTPHLEILMIGENPVVGIVDRNFESLPHLRSLVLAGMGLVEVPSKALAGLSSLESLSFYDNGLTHVPHEALQAVPTLKFLDLNKNPVRKIQEGDFKDMAVLKELGLSSMPKLISFERLSVVNLPELTKLEATNNPRLAFIHRQAFHRLPHLESLLLNDDGLGGLHFATVGALPSLREVSMHGNPLRCDCVNRWIGTNESVVRFLEPESTRCAGPPEYEGQRVRDVFLLVTGEACLPLIATGLLPSRLDVPSRSLVLLECRAVAEPAPVIYWVTPHGEKVTGDTLSEKYLLGPEGTLQIDAVELEDAGPYTCVAQNSEGADTRSVTVRVNGQLPAKESAEGLRLNVLHVTARSILVSWKVWPSVLSSDLHWSSATVRVDNTHITYTARVPIGVHEYNLTHLQPNTEYEVCLAISSRRHSSEHSCINVTTQVALLGPVPSERHASVALAAATATIFAITILASLLACGLRRLRRRAYDQSIKQYVQKGSSIPLNELYPPLIGLWEPEGDRDKEGKLVSSQVDTSRSYYMW
uniref:leucine-rich repeat neuronal protein 1 n=1 Tax=Myxine glutinosa TaxID=7769 RepID=UPI00358EC419